MELQIIDADYIVLQNKPIIRLFCKDINGETVCVFYDKFLPYFYLHADEKTYPDVIEELGRKFENAKIEIVEKTLPIGYQPSPVKVLKITGTNPQQTPELREYVRQFGTPYEADVLFKYRFMSDFGLKGMCWIDVEGKSNRTNTVKCKILSAQSIKPIDNPKNAPLKYMALDIEVLSSVDGIPTPENGKIIMLSLAFSPAYKGKKSTVFIAKSGRTEGNTVTCASEEEMLEKFKETMEDYDPDIVCGHNINGFDLPFLIKRMEMLKLQRDLGRSEKPVMLRKLQRSFIPSISGRVVVDTFEVYKRDPWVKLKRYDLSTICKEMLGEGKTEFAGANFMQRVKEVWKSSDFREFAEYCRKDSELSLRLVVERRILDKFVEIAKLSGLLLQDCLGGQSQRHECRLLREFGSRNFIMPCKPSDTEHSEEEGHGLKGAIVIDPEVGFHEWIVCLDFTSMYPSLIRAFNICTTTFMKNGENVEHYVSPYGTKFVKQSVIKGIIPQVIDEGMTARIETRKKLKAEADPETRRLLEAKQLALKDMLNSLYGYTGYSRSKLYVMDIANTITAFGRDTIIKTKDMIEKNFNVKVIYADTDSVFIKCPISDLDGAEEFGKKVSKFITEQLYGLDLKFEKTYKTFLIEAKKRYAGWAFERGADGQWKGKIDMKGIETVRRDWCDLVSETMLDVLNTVLKEKDVKKASRHVREVIDSIAKGNMPLDKLTIIKGVTKDIKAYDGVQPHVELAKKMMQRDKTKSLIGERLGYVIIRGNQLVSKRAEDPNFVKENNLQVDPEYYIYNQLLPPLERIFEVCGVSSTELIEGVKQKNLMDLFGEEKKKSPDDTVLKKFESVVCVGCNHELRRPTLSGKCPKCSGKLYFSVSGSMGNTVNLNK
jgi:DNA polymerase, archaea type